MFIITLWDIGAIIFFLVCIVIALKTWIEANINAKQYERKEEARREEERKKREDEARKAFYDAKRKAAIKRQKDWATKHPKKAKLLDVITDHPMITSLTVAFIIVAIVVAAAIVISI